MSRRWRVVLISLVVALSSCSGDVTGSEEYMALQADLDEQTSQLDAAQSQLAELQSSLDEAEEKLPAAEAALEESETRASTLEESLSDAEARAEEAEAALEEELNRPWPEEVKALFVEGCTETPNEGLTDEQEQQLCQCSMDRLEADVSLIDFLTFSILAFDDVNAEVNPITGIPTALDPDFAEALVDATTTCLFEM